jgi:hypothetical protein
MSIALKWTSSRKCLSLQTKKVVEVQIKTEFRPSKGQLSPGMVAYTCNPSYSGGKDRRITVRSQAGQQHETLSKN